VPTARKHRLSSFPPSVSGATGRMVESSPHRGSTPRINLRHIDVLNTTSLVRLAQHSWPKSPLVHKIENAHETR
jgi:hypothetical protein